MVDERSSGGHPFLCAYCGKIVNEVKRQNSHAQYGLADYYKNQISDELLNNLNAKIGCTLSKDELTGLFDYAKAIIVEDLQFEEGQDGGFITTVPGLTIKDLVEKVSESKGNEPVENAINKLSKATAQAEDGGVIIPEQTLEAHVENGIIKYIVDFNSFTYPVKRICPFCGEEIEYSAGAYPEIRIGVLGTQRQGKSGILTATVSTFENSRYGVSFEKRSLQQYPKFISDYLDRFKANLAIQKTPESERFAYRFSICVNSNGNVERWNLLFVDIAGELLQNNETAQREFDKKYSRFMRNMDCYWLCVNDFQIKRLQEAPANHGLGTVGYKKGITNELQSNDVNAMLKMLLGKDGVVPKPCLVLLDKSDTMQNADREKIYQDLVKEDGVYGYTKGNGKNLLNEEQMYVLRHNVRDYIERHNGQLIQDLESHFMNLGYLACSAYGHAVSDYNVAFRKDGQEILIYKEVDSNDKEDELFDVELHLGNRVSADSLKKMLEKKNFTPKCARKKDFLRKGDSTERVSIIAMLLPFDLRRDSDEHEGILRLLKSDEKKRTTEKWQTEDAKQLIYIQLPQQASSVFFRTDPDSDEEAEFEVDDIPNPDQIATPLLWSLAVLGKYATLGEVRKTKWRWFRKVAYIEKKTFKAGDKDSIRVLCGLLRRHT